MGDIKPCPFCGGKTAVIGTAHTKDCYFTMHRRLLDAPDGDLSLMPAVIEGTAGIPPPSKRTTHRRNREMGDVQLLKDTVRLLMQALRETPGGRESLGRLVERQPELFMRMMAAASPGMTAPALTDEERGDGVGGNDGR